MLVDVVVGYAQDADGELSEDLGASLVVLALGRVIVDTTVELEDEALRGAVEVDDEAGDDLLAPELEAAERAVAEDLPGDRFDGGRRPSKAPGELELVRVDVRAADDARACGVAHGRSSTPGRRRLRGRCDFLARVTLVVTERETMSAKDGVLPFTIEVVEDDASLTAHAGLPIVLETMRALSLSEGLNRTLGIRRRNSGATGPIPH